jgi:hypothetical protein
MTSTGLMVAGSSAGPITVHGIIGYLALLAMMFIAGWIWSIRLRKRRAIPARLRSCAIASFAIWCVVYIAGAVIGIVAS